MSNPSFFFAAVTGMNILTLVGCLPLSFFLQCKLEQQACLTGKDLSVMCTGFCPCATSTITEAKGGLFKCIYSSEYPRRSILCAVRTGFQFSHRTNQPNAWLFGSILTNFGDYCYPNLPRVAMQLFSPVLINYLECILYINAAKLYWLSRNSDILRCQLIKRVKFFCLAFLKSTSAALTGESHVIYSPRYTTKRALRSRSLNVFGEGESDC